MHQRVLRSNQTIFIGGPQFDDKGSCSLVRTQSGSETMLWATLNIFFCQADSQVLKGVDLQSLSISFYIITNSTHEFVNKSHCFHSGWQLMLGSFRLMEGRHGFRSRALGQGYKAGQEQCLSRCLHEFGRLRHCLLPLETNTNCPLAPGWRCAAGDTWLKIALLVPMRGGHTAPQHQYSALKHGMDKKGHLLAMATNVRVGYSDTNTGLVNCERHLRLRPPQD